MTHRMGIIGYGGMARWHHESLRKHLPALEVAAAADIREEARAAAAENGLAVYESGEALLAAADVDLVLVATPNDVHKPLVIRSLEAGRHVICEKPVALNAAELEDMIAASKRCGRLFSVHQNRRWDGDYRIVKHLVQSGELGEPYFIESRVQGSRQSMHGWRGHKANGGGMLLDWGVHLLDQIMDMIDSPVVSADAHLFNLYSDDVDDNIKLFLRFENGVSAVCEMSTNCLINLPRWHLSGTGGTAVVEDWECNGRMVRLKTDSEMEWEDDIVYTAAGPTRTMAPRPRHTTEESPLPSVPSDWMDYYRNVLDAIDGAAELIVRPEQCLRVMKVIDALFESDRRGCGVACRI